MLDFTVKIIEYGIILLWGMPNAKYYYTLASKKKFPSFDYLLKITRV